MNSTIILEWTFTPSDYFEEIIEITSQDYRMTIGMGTVVARIDSEFYDSNPSTRQMMHSSLNGRFSGAQLLAHRRYELYQSTITRMRPDGRKVIEVEMHSGISFSSGITDIVITDMDGNVVSDTRRDRIEKKKRLAELVSIYSATDSLLRVMLKSYDNAVHDPDNELVYLYEIRDALRNKFGGEQYAKTELGITKTQWSRLGDLCNNEPLRQGRHRGISGEALRDATESELTESRDISRHMIEAYLQYLERQN